MSKGPKIYLSRATIQGQNHNVNFPFLESLLISFNHHQSLFNHFSIFKNQRAFKKNKKKNQRIIKKKPEQENRKN